MGLIETHLSDRKAWSGRFRYADDDYDDNNDDDDDIIERKPGETTHRDEIMWAKLSIRNASPVYIESYYRPSSSFSSDSVTFLKNSLNYIYPHI